MENNKYQTKKIFIVSTMNLPQIASLLFAISTKSFRNSTLNATDNTDCNEIEPQVVSAKAELSGPKSPWFDGQVKFTQVANGDTQVLGSAFELPGRHGHRGLHILSSSSCPPINESLAGNVSEHFNPGNTSHGARTATERHLGDLGNVSNLSLSNRNLYLTLCL